MNRPHRLLILSAVLCATAFLSAALPAAAQTTAFVGATVWDGTGAPALAGATILVREGRIVSVGPAAPPAGATVVDLSGTFVTPGFVDAHAHVTGRWAPDHITDARGRVEEDLRLFARYGITTVNSLGGEPEAALLVRNTQDRPSLARARLHLAGPVITATTTVEADMAIADLAADDVDWMKIRVDDNLGSTSKMPWPVVDAVLAGAHARGFRVATHLFYLDDAKRLLREGTDLIAHSIRDQPVDSELIGLMKDRGVCYVPTLTREVSTFAYARQPEFFDDPFFLRYADEAEIERVSEPDFRRQMRESPAAARYREGLAQAQRNLGVLSQAGLPIAMGTDAGPAARFPGYFEHMELDLMAEAGMSPEQILLSATSVAASCLQLHDVGSLQAGRWADFVVFEADPLSDVGNTRRLRSVYVAGNEVR